MTCDAYDGSYDPSSPAFVADPYVAYATLRREAPVFRHEPTGQWVVTRYEDVDRLLRDRRLGRTYRHVASPEEFGEAREPEFLAPFWDLIRMGLLDMEPPDHTRLRRLVSGAFTPRVAEGLRPRVRAIAEDLVTDFAAKGGGDLVAEVAEPLPVTVISELLGIPYGDRGMLRPWSADICAMFEANPPARAKRAAARAAVEFSGYLRALARARRAAPGDDLISRLAGVTGLREAELVGTCVLLLNAGHEATVNATGNAWWALFRHADALARLRADHGLLTAAVEELLRYDTPAPVFARWVLSDIQVAGVSVPRGSQVALQFAAANRDPDVFTEPDALDLTRSPNPHVGFGAGIHFCLGAPLARIELAESLSALLRLAPRMRLAAEPAWKPGFALRGLESLQVRT